MSKSTSSFMIRSQEKSVESGKTAKALTVMRSLKRFRIFCTTSNAYEKAPGDKSLAQGALIQVDANGNDVGKPVPAPHVGDATKTLRDPSNGAIRAIGGRPVIYEVCETSASKKIKFAVPQDATPVSTDGTNSVDPKDKTPTERGAGFGDPIENKLVETTAINAVKKRYENDGWNVHSVERDRCGFDLECHRKGVVENVEVKGVRATEQCFIITTGEVEQAKKNSNFVLMVVTSALSASPILTRYSGAEFCRRFNLSPIQYRATPRS